MFDEAIRLGARGYVLKESAADDILAAIQAVASNKSYVSPILSDLLLERRTALENLSREKPELDRLTPAERRIVQLIARDKTSKEIADDLGLSPRTVDNHRNNICAKLGLRGSHSLLKWAYDNKAKL